MAFPDPITIPANWPLRSLSQDEFDTAVAGFYTYLEDRQAFEVSWGAEAESLRADLVLANLPSLTGHAGKVLAVNDSEDGATFFDYPNAFRNKIINGNFDFWQRGTSFNLTGQDYAADRWEMSPGAGQSDITRQSFTAGQTDVAGSPDYYVRIDHSTAGAANTSWTQRIEGVRTLADRTATVRFWMRSVTSAPTAFRVVLEQSFGTGGSPSANVIFDIETLTGADAPDGTWREVKYTVTFPSISGQTLGTNGDDHIVLRFTNATVETYDVDIANVSLVEGDATGEAEPPAALPYEVERGRCLRFYAKDLVLAGSGYANAVGQNSRCLMMINLPAEMRASPTVTSAAVSTDNVNADPLSGVSVITPTTIVASPLSLASGSAFWRGTITLDAEL